MSTDFSQSPEHGTNNEVELRELVYQSLERDGILSRIRAQLRAAVFKTVEKASSSPTTNTTVPTSLDTRICRAVILDWLEQTRSLYTKDIFQIETSNSSSPTMNDDELFEYLHLDSSRTRAQPILQTLIHQTHSGTRAESSSSSSLINVTNLPESMKQSIDARFPTEKINDLNRVREHFRSLFSSAFDSVVLDAYLQKSLPLNSISKYDYEQICLKWLQSCSKVLHPTPLATPSPAPVTTNGQQVTRARRALSPTSDSSSASSNASDNPRQGQFAFTLPTTKKVDEIQPPKLPSLKRDDDDDDDTTSSIFSRKNATPAALDRLKNIEDIAQGGGDTPRTRTTVDRFASHGNKDLPIEYDDESVSQMSSIDDVTVDKASPSPSAQIDFLEDL